MKTIAPDDGKSWTLRMTPEEYGERILPTASAAYKRLLNLAVGKPHVGTSMVTWEFWGYRHLELAIEVCKYAMLTLES